MTIPGVDATVALSLVAAVGDFRRFRTPEELVSYLGLEPACAAVRRSGRQPRADHEEGSCARARDARRGRVTRRRSRVRCGRSIERVRARAARRSRSSRPPASSRVVLDDDRTRRGLRVRPTFTDRQEAPRARAARRDALSARPQRHSRELLAQRGPPSRVELAEQAEHAYRQQVADWQARPQPKIGRGRRQWDATEKALCGQAARRASVPEPALRSGVDHALSKA